MEIENHLIDARRSITTGRYPVIFLSLVMVLTCASLIWFGWRAWHSYCQTKTAMEHQLRIERLRSTVIHLDEVLTMSARMAAATGNPRWEERYRSFEPALDAAIKEAMVLVPDAFSGKAAAETEVANIRLVEMEGRAFDLVRQGSLEEAKALLFSEEYDGQKRVYAQGITRFANSDDPYVRLEDLYGTVIYLDEVLTMSARMAATTGDLRWEERYFTFEPVLDAAIKEAMNLAPDAFSGEAAAETESANIKLVEMERRAFDLVREGDFAAAKALLFSEEYETQKRIYARGMTDFTSGLRLGASSVLQHGRRRAFWNIAMVLLLIPLLIMLWSVVLRVVSNWKSTLVSKEMLEIEIEGRKMTEQELAATAEAEMRSRREIEFLLRALESFTAVLDSNDIVEQLCQHINGILPNHAATVYLRTGNRFQAVNRQHDISRQMRDGDNASPSSRLLEFKDLRGPVIIPNAQESEHLHNYQLRRDTHSAVIIPLTAQHRTVGYLVAESNLAEGITEADIRMAFAVANEAAISLENALLLQEVEKLSLTDPLTGTNNRRHFDQEASRLFRLSMRHCRPLSLVMLDIDHFKIVNDTFGHDIGDKVLKKVVQACDHLTRDTDLVARFGGEEFCLLLPETTATDALNVAQKVRVAIAGLEMVADSQPFSITASFGLSECDHSGDSLEGLISRSDDALYVAKRQGRNCAVEWSPGY